MKNCSAYKIYKIKNEYKYKKTSKLKRVDEVVEIS